MRGGCWRGELHKLQDGAKSGLSFSPPGAATASARTADRLGFSPANLHRADTRTVCVAFARGLGRDELHKLQVLLGAKSGLSFSPPGAAAARSAPADRLRFSPANCTQRTIALSVLRLHGGRCEASCTSSRKAQNLLCPFHRQVPRRQVPQLIAFASARQTAQSGHSHCPYCVCAGAGARRAAQAPGRRKIWFVLFTARGAATASATAEIAFASSQQAATERTLALSVLRLRGAGARRAAQALGRRTIWFVLFTARCQRQQVLQPIALVSTQQIAQSRHSNFVCVAFALGLGRDELHKLQDSAGSGLSFSPPGAAAACATAHRLGFSPRKLHRADTRTICIAIALGLGRDELHKLQDSAESGLSFSPPGAAAASATAHRLGFNPANCTEQTLELFVLRLRWGWGETSCTSSRTAQDLVCPFHRQVPRRHVLQPIALVSAQ